MMKSKMYSLHAHVTLCILQCNHQYLGAITAINISELYVGLDTQTGWHHVLLWSSWASWANVADINGKKQPEKMEVLQATDRKQWIDERQEAWRKKEKKHPKILSIHAAQHPQCLFKHSELHYSLQLGREPRLRGHRATFAGGKSFDW